MYRFFPEVKDDLKIWIEKLPEAGGILSKTADSIWGKNFGPAQKFWSENPMDYCTAELKARNLYVHYEKSKSETIRVITNSY